MKKVSSRNLCTISMNFTYNVSNTILKHKIMVNLKFDGGIACYFGYSIIMTFMIDVEIDVIVFDPNCIINVIVFFSSGNFHLVETFLSVVEIF